MSNNLEHATEIVRLIELLRADEGDSVTILCDNPDFNDQPNCAIECCGDWTGWLHKRFAADTLLDALSMAATERQLPSPREVIATSNGHHWVKRFNLICCLDCGFVHRADNNNAPCKGVVGVGIRRDLLPDQLLAPPQEVPDGNAAKIWYHGTDVEAAEKIGKIGFKSGTWFAEHLEDALAFGGDTVFEVALDHTPVKDGNWQMCIAEPIPFDAVVSITRYNPDRTFENENLREATFSANEQVGSPVSRPERETSEGK